MKLPLIELTVDEATDAFVSAIALVENPAIESDFLAFNKVEKFAMNEDKQILIGAAMTPDKPIFRTSPKGDYYCIFSKDTIQKIQQIFFKKGLIQSLNIDHNAKQPCLDSYIFQSYITDETMGVSAPNQLGELPDGTWIIGVKIDNAELWKQVKEGKVKGFSVEGIFSMLPTDISVEDITPADDDLELTKALNDFNKVLEKVTAKKFI
ncbi:putative serine protease XkdF [Mucilaginibacter gracilis]|uniref:Putative serine protease XkdF n=1 Tax=Mucilaginibacter gracilis TaxID=423350 RepID=A0A495J0Y5_9SPHI|nr:XkdF-like putative serine protease domain-containing protein [Mucilaginibacter gracilis]RKR82655.1 putative serine protease XkdF [Mucilaginibacter gracilis]